MVTAIALLFHGPFLSLYHLPGTLKLNGEDSSLYSNKIKLFHEENFRTIINLMAERI